MSCCPDRQPGDINCECDRGDTVYAPAPSFGAYEVALACKSTPPVDQEETTTDDVPF